MSEFLHLPGSVNEILGLGSFDGYKRHKNSGEIKRNEPILDALKNISKKAMYGKNYQNKEDDNYKDY